MRHKYLLTALFILPLFLANAQLPGIRLSKYYTATAPGTSYGQLGIFDCKPTSDKGFIMAGVDSLEGTYDFDFNFIYKRQSGAAALIKTDSAGNVIWRVLLPANPFPTVFSSVVQTSDGGYVATGFSGFYFLGVKQLLVAKVSAAGELLWRKEYGGVNDDLGYSIIRCKAGGFLVTGSSSSNNGNVSGNHGGGDFWVLRLDEMGNLIWQKCFGGTESEVGRSVVETANNQFVFCGSVSSNDGDAAANNGIKGGWLFKTDSSGNVLWQKSYGVADSTGLWMRFNDVAVDASGNIYAAGFEESSKLGGVNQWVTSNIWVIKVNPLGEIIWSKVFGGSRSEHALTIKFSFNGSLLITGFSDSPDGDFTAINTGDGFPQTFMLNLSTDGDVLGRKIVGGNMFDAGFSFFQLNETEFILAASSSQYQGMLIKLGEANIIKGQLYLDANSNNTKDGGETIFNNALVTVKKQSSEIIAANPYNGYFEVPVDTGTFITTVQLFNPYYTVVPASRNSTFSSYLNIDSFGFAVQPIPNKQDLIVHLIPVSPARPGFKAQYVLNYKNIGTTTIASGSVKLIKDSRTALSISLPFPAAVVADTITWNYTNLKPLDSVAIGIELQLAAPPTLNINDTLKYSAVVLPVVNDLTPSDDTSSLRQRVQGSYDPNDKLESFAGRMPLRKVQDGAYINYIIRFQNTGNDTAFTVRLLDTLESKLDWSAFQMIGSSHKYNLTIKEGNKLQWVFNDIKLPDSTTNLLRSIGFVSFRIKPKSTVAQNDVIKNKASIYFDYNLPIVTNSADIAIANDVLTFVREVQNNEMKLQLGPNPTNSYSNLFISGKLKGRFELRVVDNNGRIISQQTIIRNTNAEVNNISVHLEKLSAGIYYIQLQQKNKTWWQKIILQ